jgi:hypothetical protein
MKKVLIVSGQIFVLTLLGILSMIVASLIIPQPSIIAESRATINQQEAGQMLFLSRFVLSLIFAFIISRSRVSGIKLLLNLLCITFGISTFVMQLETIIFIKAFPSIVYTDVLLLALTALVSNVIFVPLAIMVFGKWKKSIGTPSAQISFRGFYYKISLIAAIYVGLYFFFGYFVAFQFSEVRDFYQNTSIQNDQITLGLIQFLRGILWVIVGLPLFYLFDKKLHLVIASVLVYSIFSSIALILPNPLMPEAVRFGHFLEISSSMAVFGFIVPLILHHKKSNL